MWFFFLINGRYQRKGAFSKQTIIVILKVLHHQKMKSWAIGQQSPVSGMWRKRVPQHQYHCKKSGRVCLQILLHNVYLLSDGYLVLTWVMTFHIVKTKPIQFVLHIAILYIQAIKCLDLSLYSHWVSFPCVSLTTELNIGPSEYRKSNYDFFLCML